MEIKLELTDEQADFVAEVIRLGLEYLDPEDSPEDWQVEALNKMQDALVTKRADEEIQSYIDTITRVFSKQGIKEWKIE